MAQSSAVEAKSTYLKPVLGSSVSVNKSTENWLVKRSDNKMD